MKIVGLWRYPVKSMGGEPLDTVEVGERGLVGDRVLAVVRADSGHVLTAKREPRLLSASARWLGGAVVMTLPGGRTVRSDDPDVAEVLSDWLGRPVRLARPGPGRRSVEPYAADPDGVVADSTFDLAEGGFFDDAPIHLLDRESLRRGRSWHPGDWDVRRFRPNVVLDGAIPAAGPVELSAVRLEVTGPCKRCVMVTQPQDDLLADRRILSTLIKRSAAAFGVYASVARTGFVRTGDLVTEPGFQVAGTARPGG